MNRLSKKEVVKSVASQKGLRQKEVDQVLSQALTVVKKSLSEEKKVFLSGFGTFKIVEKKQRRGRNPKTGEEIVIPARKTVSFKPSKELLTLLND